MCRRVGIAAHNRHTGQREAALRPHHMDDTVLRVHHAEVGQTEIGRILGQRVHLCFADRVLYRLILVVRRSIVVRHTINVVGTETFQASGTHAGESLRTGHFMTI